MSSLLQHHGGRSPDGRKVELLCYRVVKGPDWERYNGPESYNPSPESSTFCVDAELIPGTALPRLYRFYRRPRGMWGCWVVFEYNGEKRVPDLSVPLALLKLPRDAEPVPDAEALKFWNQ